MAKKRKLTYRERMHKIHFDAARRLGKKGSFILQNSRMRTGLNAERKYRAASLIKIPLAIALMHGVEKGALGLDELLTVTEENMVEAGEGKGGDVDHAGEGARFTVDDVLYHALANSDNSATNMLIGYVGMDNVNRIIEAYGAKDTVLARKMYDWDAARKGKENYTTPAEIAVFFESLRRKDALPPRYCRRLLHIMAKSKFKDKLTKKLPEKIKEFLPRKGGTLSPANGMPEVVHDAGIVYAPGRPYTIGVFTEGVEKEEAKGVIADVSKAAYEIMRA
jgi:beta-lactamase class A